MARTVWRTRRVPQRFANRNRCTPSGIRRIPQPVLERIPAGKRQRWENTKTTANQTGEIVGTCRNPASKAPWPCFDQKLNRRTQPARAAHPLYLDELASLRRVHRGITSPQIQTDVAGAPPKITRKQLFQRARSRSVDLIARNTGNLDTRTTPCVGGKA